MHKTSTINVRIETAKKVMAEKILNETGLTSAEAIRLFYTQVCLNQGLPFEVKIPSATTRSTLKAIKRGGKVEKTSIDQLKTDWDKACEK